MKPNPILPEVSLVEYPTRSVPVDSAALYEAVNAWVEALVEARELARLGTVEDWRASREIPTRAQALVELAAETLAETRYERRRGQQGEGR